MKDGRKKRRRHLTIWMALILMLLACGGSYLSATAYTERAAVVSSDGDPVNVRSGPGTSNAWVATLPHGTKVTIIGEATASDGSKWYEIRFAADGTTKTGFMHSAYLIYEDYSGLDDVEKRTFEELLAEFPESYKTQLLILHDMYPSWKFVAVRTGLDWNEALTAESSNSRSLVATGAISSWKSLEGNAYDWNTSTWKAMDGPKWVTASREIVAYYMDPRNYLDGSMIFAFITHEYDSAEQTIEGVRSVIGNTFMSKDFDENGAHYSYAEVLMEAARQYGVSPYVLAAMIRIEIGYDGTSPSISGVEPGYEGLYNYYNVGAYAIGEMTANQRGLWYAAGAGQGDTSYGRPWDSRYKSLMGGAEFYASTYVQRGQNTLYLKRFNVTANNTYEHQYMTNIQGAASEANVYSLAYNAQAKQQNLVFYVPVYENMPETPCVKPTKYGSPNNKLASISVNGTVLPDFNMDTAAYRVEAAADLDKIKLEAAPKDGSAAITGVGEFALAAGENTFTIQCTAQNGDVRNYTVTVVRTASSDASLAELKLSAGTLTPAFDSQVFDYRVVIPADQTSLTVTATAKNNQAAVTVTGGNDIPVGESLITVSVTAGDGVTKAEYRITVERPAANPEVTIASEVYKVGEDKLITGITQFPVSASDFLAAISVTNGTAALAAPDGNQVTGNVGTGMQVKIYDSAGILCDIYTVVIYGDVSGDGVIDALDLMTVRQYLKKRIDLSGPYYAAANVSHDGAVDALDLMMIRQHLKLRLTIGQ